MVNRDEHGHDSKHSIPAETEIMDRHFAPDSVLGVLCIGVCCGYEVGQLAKHYSKADVHALEADFRNFCRYLDDERPCCPDTVKTFCKAVSDRDGVATLYVSELHAAYHSLLALKHDAKPREIAVTTAMRHCWETGLRPEILMVDVEGIPLRVLRGLGDYINGVKAVIIETERQCDLLGDGGDHHDQVVGFLESHGFDQAWSNGTDQVNSLWIRRA